MADTPRLVDPHCAVFLPTKPPSPEAEAAFRGKAEEGLVAALMDDADPQLPHLTPETREELRRCIDPFPPIADQHGRPARGPSIGSLPWGGPFVLAGRADDE